MKNKLKTTIFLLFSILLVFVSCDSGTTLEDKIIDEWLIDKVYEADKDVSADHNPQNNRWIRFNEDGSFESGGDPFGDNTGTWEIDANKSILFIYSSVKGDDSEWKISFKDNETIWTGIGTPRKENFKLIHKKSAQ